MSCRINLFNREIVLGLRNLDTFTKQVRFRLTHIAEYTHDLTQHEIDPLTQIDTPNTKYFFVMIELVAHVLVRTHWCAKTKIVR